MLAALAASAPPAHAQDAVAEARRLFDEGREALHAARLTEAKEKLRRSLELHPNAATAFNLVLAYRGSGEPLEATRVCERLLAGDYGELAGERRAQASDTCEAAAAEIAHIEARAEGAERIDLRLDGAAWTAVAGGEVARADVDPGRHVISASAAAHAGEERAVTVERGGTASVVLRVVPEPTEREGSPATWWIVAGAGAAVVVGVIVAAVLLSGGDDGPQAIANPDWGGVVTTLRP